MTINQRIGKLIEHFNLNPKSFSEQFGVKEANTRNYLYRGSMPSAEYLEKLFVSIENLNSEWLLAEKGKMFKEEEAQKVISSDQAKADGVPDDAIPLYEIDINAGNVQRLIEANETIPLIGWMHLEDAGSASGLIGVGAKGNSMSPFINNGDTMLIRRIENLNVVPPGEAYVVITDEQSVVKYIRTGSTQDKWTLRSHNREEYDDFEISKTDVKHLFAVVKVLKTLTY